jgi:hypothetical protein
MYQTILHYLHRHLFPHYQNFLMYLKFPHYH